MSPAEPIDSARLRAGLAHQRIGHSILVFDETTSTNDEVARMAAEHAEGLVVFAEQQTAGRGQYGRRWDSPAGKGLWLSVLLRPRIEVADSARLTDLLAQVIAATIAGELMLPAEIKSPNDIYVGGRKVAGVLVEMKVERDGGYCAVAGLGINANQELADFPSELRDRAGSLALATGARIDRTAFAIALLRRLESSYAAAAL